MIINTVGTTVTLHCYARDRVERGNVHSHDVLSRRCGEVSLETLFQPFRGGNMSYSLELGCAYWQLSTTHFVAYVLHQTNTIIPSE